MSTTQHPAVPQNAVLAPRNDVERRLVTIWQTVLDVSPIGVQDDFFDLGGHSLLAARLSAAVREEFGTNLPLAVLFDAPTVERMAEILARKKRADRVDAAGNHPIRRLPTSLVRYFRRWRKRDSLSRSGQISGKRSTDLCAATSRLGRNSGISHTHRRASHVFHNRDQKRAASRTISHRRILIRRNRGL
jgi:acyl carrier protein